jgi:FemAB-related protein (PEP-CTERM system-associated)
MAHLWQWRPLIQEVFGHSSTYLIARRHGAVVGVLPLIRFRSWLFGRFLVSMPFLNYGGIAAVDDEAANALLAYAGEVASSHRAQHMELRHVAQQCPNLPCRQHKVAMRLTLERTSEAMWEALDRKVRNQVRKAQKAGLTASSGGGELVAEFYEVFARNMRDLGTPVYSRRLFEHVVSSFPDRARLFVVRHRGRVIAGAVAFAFRDTLEVPWASSLAEFRGLCPNMLLYWTAIEWACTRGFSTFDFGRSTPDQGTYHFKKQWGAVSTPLSWEYAFGRGQPPVLGPDNPKARLAVRLWKHLPVRLSTTIGPHVVRVIP